MAKILVLDIETAPMKAAIWGMWQQNISVKMMEEAGYILCWSAKWLGDPHIYYEDGRVRPANYDEYGRTETDKGNEHALLSKLIPLLDGADMVVGHNLIKFDMPKIRGRCLVHGLPLPSPYKEIDTCRAARREFGFESNSLEFLCNVLKVDHRKSDHPEFPGYKLWDECINGNREAWKAMKEYNIEDIKTTEDVYIAMRPYMTQHPNVGVFTDNDDPTCPKCGSTDVNHNKTKWAYTNIGKYKRYRCNSCGGWARGRSIIGSPSSREHILVNQVS